MSVTFLPLPRLFQAHLFFSGPIHSFFVRMFFFSAQAEYSYFSADLRLTIFLYYSQMVWIGEGGGGGYKCQLSVKISAICQLSVK